MTNPTNEHREQAREIVAKWKRDIGQVVRYERMEADIAVALSERDDDLRDAVDVLGRLAISFDLADNPALHWCEDVEHCIAFCQEVRGVYARLQARLPNAGEDRANSETQQLQPLGRGTKSLRRYRPRSNGHNLRSL